MTSYSRYRHRKLKTRGHLFERRHGAWLVDSDTYLLMLLRYIHLNPVSAHMVERAEDYPWSSHRAYLGKEVIPWLTIDFGLSIFGTTIDAARASYAKLVSGALSASEERLFEREPHPEDPRIIGGDSFLSSLAVPPFKPRSRLTLEELAKLACEQKAVSLETLRSPLKHRVLSNARADLAIRALDGRVASMHDIARLLGRSPAAISRLLSRRRRM